MKRLIGAIAFYLLLSCVSSHTQNNSAHVQEDEIIQHKIPTVWIEASRRKTEIDANWTDRAQIMESLMVRPQQVVDGFNGVKCFDGHFDKYGVPVAHRAIPQAG